MSYLDQEEKIFIGQAVFEFEGLHKLKDHSSGQEQLVSLLFNKTKIVNLPMIYMLSIYILLNYLLNQKCVPTLAKTLLQREQISRTCCSLKEQFRMVKLRSLENGSKIDYKEI